VHWGLLGLRGDSELALADWEPVGGMEKSKDMNDRGWEPGKGGTEKSKDIQIREIYRVTVKK